MRLSSLLALALASLLLLAAAPITAEQAERNFASAAQTQGQWTAFRAYASPGGFMFVPEATDAQTWLKDRKDPPSSVMWWPAQSWVSCDGTMAVNTGPWVRQGGKSVGYFTTIWTRQPDGAWKWILDHGDALTRPRTAGEKAKVRRASCSRLSRPGKMMWLTMDSGSATGISVGGQKSEGTSADGSIKWIWQTREDGGRTVSVSLWNGARHEPVIADEVAGGSQ